MPRISLKTQIISFYQRSLGLEAHKLQRETMAVFLSQSLALATDNLGPEQPLLGVFQVQVADVGIVSSLSSEISDPTTAQSTISNIWRFSCIYDSIIRPVVNRSYGEP